MNVEQAAVELARLKNLFCIMADTAAIYPVWESLVIQHRVSGKPAHDARLVAAMQVHGITSIHTFNTSDFVRYPGIKVVDPATVVLPARTRGVTGSLYALSRNIASTRAPLTLRHDCAQNRVNVARIATVAYAETFQPIDYLDIQPRGDQLLG
jgi:hypothetical protein